MRTKLPAAAALLAALALLAACHTVQGAKQDLSAAGQAISHTVHKMTQ